MKKLIGIGGVRYAGKSTAASYFVEELGFKELSFAYPLKKVTALSFALGMENFEVSSLKEKPFNTPLKITLGNLLRFRNNLEEYGAISDSCVREMYEHAKEVEIAHPRHLLQYLGTDLVRKFVDTEYWVNALVIDIAKCDKVVISDMRFKNERDLVDEMGGKLILIKRPGYEASGHISETGLGEESEYNVTIDNNSTIKDLFKELAGWYSDGQESRQVGSRTSEGYSETAEERDSQPKEAFRLVGEENS